jgi:hypothetical protein
MVRVVTDDAERDGSPPAAAVLVITLEVTVAGFGAVTLEAIAPAVTEAAVTGIMRRSSELVGHRGLAVGSSSRLIVP